MLYAINLVKKFEKMLTERYSNAKCRQKICSMNNKKLDPPQAWKKIKANKVLDTIYAWQSAIFASAHVNDIINCYGQEIVAIIEKNIIDSGYYSIMSQVNVSVRYLSLEIVFECFLGFVDLHTCNYNDLDSDAGK